MDNESLYGDGGGYPPFAFYFKISFPGTPEISDSSFKEVSGLSTEIELDPITEGGENQYKHNLPKGIKHSNLILKRGITKTNSNLYKWVKYHLEGNFSELFTPKSIQIDLFNINGTSIRSWTCDHVIPIKWDLGGLDSQKNEIAIESMEFAYNTLKREK